MDEVFVSCCRVMMFRFSRRVWGGRLTVALFFVSGVVWGGLAGAQDFATQIQLVGGTARSVENSEVVGLRYERVDVSSLAEMDAREILAAVTLELLQMDSSEAGLGQSSREELLRRVQKFAEQALQYEQQTLRHHDERRMMDSESIQSTSTQSELANWETRYSVAQQRWPMIRERLPLVEARWQESERDERILLDFIEDDGTLDRFLLIHAERISRQAEYKMLLAELALMEVVLDEAPRVIKKLKKLADLQPSYNAANKSEPPLDQANPALEGLLPVAGAKELPSESRDNRQCVDSSAKEQLLKIRSRVLEVLEEISTVGKQLESIESKTQSLRDKYERFGLVEGNQLLFLEAHRRLPSEDEIRIRNHETRQELRDLNVALLAAEKGLTLERERGSGGNNASDADGRRVSEDGYQELLAEIEGLYQRLIELTSERERLILAVEELRYFLDHKLLWVRNSEPLGVAVIVRSSEGLWSLLQPGAWIDLLRGLFSHLTENPVQLTGWLLGLFFLRWLSGKFSAGQVIRGAGA
jgi:hypothetical protein